MRRGDLVLTSRDLRFGGRRFPVAVGRGGITTAKREGDGATPAGAHAVTAILYRPDRVARPAPGARPIRSGDLWSDDPRDMDYNQPVRAPHGFGHERLRRADPLYDVMLLTDWNRAGTPFRGSAIFVHVWRAPRVPTAGCIALRRRDLLWIAARVTPRSRLVVPTALAS